MQWHHGRVATVNGGKRRSNKQQIGTNPPREIAARRLPAPLGVGRVGAAILGAAGADVEEGAVPGVVERVAAVKPHPLPVEQVALVLIARRRYLPSRLSRLENSCTIKIRVYHRKLI